MEVSLVYKYYEQRFTVCSRNGSVIVVDVNGELYLDQLQEDAPTSLPCRDFCLIIQV